MALTFFLFNYMTKIDCTISFSMRRASMCMLCMLVLLLNVGLKDGHGLERFILSLGFEALLMPLTAMDNALLFSTVKNFLLDH